MLSTEKDHVDYGSLLECPAGYELSFAVGTTYSLDMQTLLSACLSLGLSVSTDSSIGEDPMCLFSALEKVRSKVLVFCQKGRILGGGGYRNLYSLLEDSIVQVNLPASKTRKFPSFHPKVWILRFVGKNNPDDRLYRICILSRNISRDTSWDVAASFEGRWRPDAKQASDYTYVLVDFVRELRRRWDTKHRTSLDDFASELPYVPFKSTGGDWQLELPFLFTGVATNDDACINSEFERLLDCSRRVLVMSPFLSGEPDGYPLHDIYEHHLQKGLPTSDVFIVTRRSSLRGLGTGADWLREFRVFAMRDDLLSFASESDTNPAAENSGSEEEIPGAQSRFRDIHAKLFVFESDSTEPRADMLLGSANATWSGLKANCEADVHLRSDNPDAFDNLLSDLMLDEKSLEEDKSIFEELDFEDKERLLSDPPHEEAQSTDCFQHFLREIDPRMYIVQHQDDGLYRVELTLWKRGTCIDLPPEPDGVKVRLASCSAGQDVERFLVFDDVDLESLTEFLCFVCPVGDFSIKRFVKCEVREGGGYLERRRSRLFSQVLHESNRSPVDYIDFALSSNPRLWNSVAALKSRNTSANSMVSLPVSGLYEQLLKAYARDGQEALDTITDCRRLLEDLEDSKDALNGVNETLSDLKRLLEVFGEGALHVE